MSVRLKVDVCFVYTAPCQKAAIFDEAKTAFLALSPLAAACQERLFSPVYMQVK